MKLDWASEIDHTEEPNDRIDFVFDSAIWEGPKDYDLLIGVYNSQPEKGPQEFSI